MADTATTIAIICYIEWGLIHIAAGLLTCFGTGAACLAGPTAGGLVPIALMGGMSDDEKDAFKAVKYAIIPYLEAVGELKGPLASVPDFIYECLPLPNFAVFRKLVPDVQDESFRGVLCQRDLCQG